MSRGVEYSDRVWCTLLWEFMQYAEGRIKDESTIRKAMEIAKLAGVRLDEEMFRQANPEIEKAIALVAPSLFLEFLRENPEILGEHDLIAWVKAKQVN